jgi:hypothetical protein
MVDHIIMNKSSHMYKFKRYGKIHYLCFIFSAIRSEETQGGPQAFAARLGKVHANVGRITDIRSYYGKQPGFKVAKVVFN